MIASVVHRRHAWTVAFLLALASCIPGPALAREYTCNTPGSCPSPGSSKSSRLPWRSPASCSSPSSRSCMPTACAPLALRSTIRPDAAAPGLSSLATHDGKCMEMTGNDGK
jgi:hypothetical protein